MLVTEVLYIAKTHLDVGFTATAAQVRRRYLEDFFPAALSAAEQLRSEGGPAQLRWTTGSWILTEALDSAQGAERARLEQAIVDGVLCWQALPFTLHTELCDRSLLEHALSLSAELDRRFERRTRAAKMTDVPGHTRAMVPVLLDAGVDFLHIGVNPAASAPDVPLQFRWADPAMAVMYQPASYGDVQIVEGTDVAVFVDLTGDNLGPRDAAGVRERFAELAERFPGAVVRAATLDDVAHAVRTSGAQLPFVAEEIGDTWLHGAASDPPKLAAFGALCRRRAGWIDDGVIDAEEPSLRRASTRLLLVAEHTWGLDQKEHWPELGAWSTAELARLRSSASTRAFEASWAEQRDHLHEFCDELAVTHPGLAAQARADVAGGLDPQRADRVAPRGPDGVVPVVVGEPVELDGWTLRLGADGALDSLIDPTGIERVAAGGRLGALAERTFDAADYERWFSTYNGGTVAEDEWWARWDNTKPGLEHTHAVSRRWPARLSDAAVVTTSTGRQVLRIELEVPRSPGDPIALRPTAVVEVGAVARRPGGRHGPVDVIEFRLEWRRDAARWPEATWWSFEPAVRAEPGKAGWRVQKVGEWIDPALVVPGGARLHAVQRIAHADGTTLTPLDAPLVTDDPEVLLRWDSTASGNGNGAPPRPRGWHVLCQANLWGTNFPMWTDDRCAARVVFS